MTEKRKLTRKEIEDILSSLEINPEIPKNTANSVLSNYKKDAERQLCSVELYPEIIPLFTEEFRKTYVSTLAQAGECVGVIVAQSIGERQTQSNLNTFHKAGSSDKQPVVANLSEILNATSKPKIPSYNIFFRKRYETLQEIRNDIKGEIRSLTVKDVAQVSSSLENKKESWYNIYECLFEKVNPNYTACVKLKFNMDILYEYKLSLSEIAEKISSVYTDIQCVFSPDVFGEIDILINTDEINLDEEIEYITEENKVEIYLEEKAIPTIEKISVCGIQGILDTYFNRTSDDEWYIESENTRDKKQKQTTSCERFRKLLSSAKVDSTRTVSNNMWDIYQTLGVEAVRQFLLEQFISIMEGINVCHIMLLVDKMTFTGMISSVTRYTMKKDGSSVFSCSSFEETLDNFLRAGLYGRDDDTKGVSASIICGKRSKLGTGLCETVLDTSKILPTISEDL